MPSSLRDVLLRSAAAGLFRVHWSSDILDEVRRTLINEISISEDSVERLLTTLRRAFPEAEVRGYEPLIDGLSVDPEDRHVLAAAIVARADVIVTRNVRHFPLKGTEPFAIQVHDPDTFLIWLFDLFPDELVDVIRSRANDLGDSVPETLSFLRRHVTRFVETLEAADSFF